MHKIIFTKMVASGNDFAVVDSRKLKGRNLNLSLLAKGLCNRKFGIGADGLLLMEKSSKASVRMRVFNSDGSEAEMCGNGARCAAFWQAKNQKAGKSKVNIETKAGIIECRIKGNNVKIRLTDPNGLKLNLPVNIGGRKLRINFINTGVPHAVIFVSGLNNIDVDGIGRKVRFHKRFSPAGTNVDFVEPSSKDCVCVRTYERGVEGETLACGTGSVASALVTAYNLMPSSSGAIDVKTRSGEVLRVYFDKSKGTFKNVWLEGSVRKVYKGEYYV